MRPVRLSDVNLSGPGVAVFVLCLIAGVAVSAAAQRPEAALAGGLLGLYLLFAIRVLTQWQRVALLRLGRYSGLRGPGTF